MASAVERVFRKAALDRIASPEHLDRMVTVAGARSWVAVAGLGLGLAFLVGWGMLGAVPTNVTAKGILVAAGGRVVVATAPANGVVDSLPVGVGDEVAKGQVVARIRQDETRQRLDHARQTVADRDAALHARKAALESELQASLATIAQRQTALAQSMTATRERIAYQEQQLRNRRDMLAMGFATADTIHAAQDELSRAKHDLAESRAALSAATAEAMQARLKTDAELRQLAGNVAEAGRRAEELSTEIALSSEVVAPAAGRITEIKLTEGVMVAAGQPMLAIESAGQGLQAVVYIPTEHGKKVAAGMLARIAPAPVKKEEAGTLVGRVTQVTPFPATRQGIAAVVQNDTLVEDFVKKGAPFEARVDLVPADGPSGYAWSSGTGPDITLTSGTTVEAALTVREQRPIALILPFLRRSVGLDR